MNDDLLLAPARYNGAEDDSDYQELLPVSLPRAKPPAAFRLRPHQPDALASESLAYASGW